MTIDSICMSVCVVCSMCVVCVVWYVCSVVWCGVLCVWCVCVCVCVFMFMCLCVCCTMKSEVVPYKHIYPTCVTKCRYIFGKASSFVNCHLNKCIVFFILVYIYLYLYTSIFSVN